MLKLVSQVLLMLLFPLSAFAANEPNPACTQGPLADSSQVILSVIRDWNSTDARVLNFKKDGSSGTGADWKPLDDKAKANPGGLPAAIGLNGCGWSRGDQPLPDDEIAKSWLTKSSSDLVQTFCKCGGSFWNSSTGQYCDEIGQDSHVKFEGDNRSPCGVFSLGEAFGYASAQENGVNPSEEPYLQANENSHCIDTYHAAKDKPYNPDTKVDGTILTGPACHVWTSDHYNDIISDYTTDVDLKKSKDRGLDNSCNWRVKSCDNAATPGNDETEEMDRRLYKDGMLDDNYGSPSYKGRPKDSAMEYEFGMQVDNHTDGQASVQGGGSCIFMHVHKDPINGIVPGTAGCTAFDRDDIKRIVQETKAKAKPKLVQLTIDDYEKHEVDWCLPQIDTSLWKDELTRADCNRDLSRPVDQRRFRLACEGVLPDLTSATGKLSPAAASAASPQIVNPAVSAPSPDSSSGAAAH